jgi:hypothetical protein
LYFENFQRFLKQLSEAHDDDTTAPNYSISICHTIEGSEVLKNDFKGFSFPCCDGGSFETKSGLFDRRGFRTTCTFNLYPCCVGCKSNRAANLERKAGKCSKIYCTFS